jgi:hypothetical protein
MEGGGKGELRRVEIAARPGEAAEGGGHQGDRETTAAAPDPHENQPRQHREPKEDRGALEQDRNGLLEGDVGHRAQAFGRETPNPSPHPQGIPIDAIVSGGDIERRQRFMVTTTAPGIASPLDPDTGVLGMRPDQIGSLSLSNL